MRFIFVLWGMLMIMGAVAQDSDNMVKYTHDFKFTEGIYMNFEQVRANEPIPKYKILTNADFHDPEFFDKVLSRDQIYYFDDNAVRQEIQLNDIWGYSRNGVLYIRLGSEFNRVTIVGGICHFVGTVTVTDTRYIDPYYNRYNYYNYYNSYYNPYYYNPMRTQTYSRTEMNQYILDFETGKVMEYVVESLEIALMRDPELYDEYLNLRSKDKKKLKFLYIRKFNERNPIYLPE
jgi:hypothetical protein